MIINGVERFKWDDRYRVLDGYGEYSDKGNKGSPRLVYISPYSLDPRDIAASAANKAINKIIGTNSAYAN